MRRIMFMVPFVLTASLLAGCSAGSGSSGDALRQEGGVANPQTVPMPESMVGGDPNTWGPATDKASGIVGPQIITTVNLTVSVAAPRSAADDASKIAEKFGGSVASRSENSGTDRTPGSAQLTLRIPSEKLNQALEELKGLGTALDTTINAQDVTAEATDLDARITSLQTSVDRLLTLMSQATSTENLLAVEAALSQRQADLESLQAQKRYLDNQVQLSTVNLYLQSEASTPAPDPNNFWTGLVTGWNAFVGFWAVALVVFGVLIPWLAAAGLITFLVIFLVKWGHRRSAAKKLAATKPIES